MDQSQLKWIADFIWNIADDRLRDVYVRGKYRDVILPFIVVRRLDALLVQTKPAVLAMKKMLDAAGVANQDGALRNAAGHPIHHSKEQHMTTTLTPAQHAILAYALEHTEGRIEWLLHELPVDTTLREFLTGHGLMMPSDFAWIDKPETTLALIEAVLTCPDVAVRDAVAAKLRASVALGDSAGTQAMFQVATGNGAILAGLATCKSDTHRSFWLYVKHPDLFDRAGDVDNFERQVAQAQQHDLGVKKTPDTSDAALAALRADVSAFYQREMQCGDRSKAYVVERSPGVYLLSVHIKDLPMVKLEFDGNDLKRRVGNPNIHSVLEYSARTGVTRSLIKGGAKYHQMLLKAFSEHLLHVKLDAHRLVPPTLDLSVLRLGFDVPQAEMDGFNVLQVKSISLLSPDTQLKLDCTAMSSSEHRSVTELLEEKLPGPLAENSGRTQTDRNRPPKPSAVSVELLVPNPYQRPQKPQTAWSAGKSVH